MSDAAYDKVIEYHQRTKHSLQQYAAGPKALDGEAQPDPFQRFDGAKRITLSPPGNNMVLSVDHYVAIPPVVSCTRQRPT